MSQTESAKPVILPKILAYNNLRYAPNPFSTKVENAEASNTGPKKARTFTTSESVVPTPNTTWDQKPENAYNTNPVTIQTSNNHGMIAPKNASRPLGFDLYSARYFTTPF